MAKILSEPRPMKRFTYFTFIFTTVFLGNKTVNVKVIQYGNIRHIV